MSGPLEGVRIVELGQMIAVPGATYLLATQGATSVKVEGVDRGDDLRAYGSQKGGMSAWFANANAGKESIGLDLQSPAGKEILWRLVDDADVFIQGFRPGAVARLGFGPDEVLARNPAIVYVSSAGFGTTGPYVERPVYDPVIQSLSGWAGSQTTDVGPTLIRGMVADKVAAITAAQAITAALVSRGRTGKGQHVEMSMLEANIAFNWPDAMMHCTLLDDDATHLPNLLSYYQLFASADGWVCVTAGNDAQWASVCNALDRPELAVDERLATAGARGQNFPYWYAMFEEMCAAFPSDELLRRCQAADVPAVPVLDPTEVADDEQVIAREALRIVEHPIVGKMRVPRQGARFTGDGEATLSPAPMHGEHTDRLLESLGYAPDDISGLRSAGTVA